MNKFRLMTGAMLAALLALSPVVSYAESENASQVQGGNFGGLHESLDFSGVKVKRVVASATATLLATGEGFLDGICPFGGTLGQYSMAYDAVATDGPSIVEDAFAYSISPKVYTTNDSTSSAHGMVGCWYPPAPVKFLTGLYGKASNAGHSTLFLVHCSDGSNPCSL